ncbi:DUF3617 domain-containing protein [Psychromonas sp. PT13]|uniref:DUF3617 domain-containing protein n=1 Tax=Psychromonas sp. PT13 TaxID=3439547 RepID=UPI003EBAFAC3
MRVVTSKAALLGLIIASTNLYAEDYNFKPGLWEFTSIDEIIEIDAPPGMEKLIRMSYESESSDDPEVECINDFEHYIRNQIQNADEDEDEHEKVVCNQNIKRISANKMESEISCAIGQNGTSLWVAETNFNGESLTIMGEELVESNFNNELGVSGHLKMKIKTSENGRYIGSCKSEPNE